MIIRIIGEQVPRYSTPGSAGADLFAAVSGKISPGVVAKIPTGLFLEIPPNHEGQVRMRSGLAKKGIIMPNSPGTIDSDYRGEVSVLLMNLSGKPYKYAAGDKIAQLVISEYCKAEFIPCLELSDTKRGSGGFGSTGR